LSLRPAAMSVWNLLWIAVLCGACGCHDLPTMR
jgi:hypothetical protein